MALLVMNENRCCLFAQQFEELGENCLAMSFMSPDNLDCVMIDDHCYVLVSLLVAGFINAYADKSREACGWTGIKFSPHPANDSPKRKLRAFLL